MQTNLLRNIGLTDSEIKVYLALLELGSTTKGPIVEKSKVASSKIYELLDKLSQKGLVSEVIKAGIKYFEASPATRILDYLKEKEENIKKQGLELQKLIPELEMKRSLAKNKSETQVFKTMKGAKTAFEDILTELKKGDEYYVLGISKFTKHFERFVNHFHNERSKKGIRCKIIVNEVAKRIGSKLNKIKLTKVRYLKKELFTPVVFIIYKDKTLISIGLDEIFIQIKSENLSKGLKNYFKYMWKIATDGT